jgi:hypothetical protein
MLGALNYQQLSSSGEVTTSVPPDDQRDARHDTT